MRWWRLTMAKITENKAKYEKKATNHSHDDCVFAYSMTNTCMSHPNINNHCKIKPTSSLTSKESYNRRLWLRINKNVTAVMEERKKIDRIWECCKSRDGSRQVPPSPSHPCPHPPHPHTSKITQKSQGNTQKSPTTSLFTPPKMDNL